MTTFLGPAVGQRNPRYKRTPAPRIELQPRDVRILYGIFKYRFLNTPLIHLYAGGGEQWLTRRLNLLWKHEYIDRISLPMRPSDKYGGGSLPMTYGTSNKGYEFLSSLYPKAFPKTKIDWTQKNKIADPKYIPHTLGIAEVMVRLEAFCRSRDDARLIERPEIIKAAPEAARNRKNPSGWSVPSFKRGKDGEMRKETKRLVPDDICQLHFLNEPVGRQNAWFFLEVDRAREPVTREIDPALEEEEQSSVAGKFPLYVETFRQKLHTEYYGMKNFRVLVVTTSHERVKNMIKANKTFNEGKGSRIFCFTTMNALKSCNDILTLKWLNGQEQETTLMD